MCDLMMMSNCTFDIKLRIPLDVKIYRMLHSPKRRVEMITSTITIIGGSSNTLTFNEFQMNDTVCCQLSFVVWEGVATATMTANDWASRLGEKRVELQSVWIYTHHPTLQTAETLELHTTNCQCVILDLWMIGHYLTACWTDIDAILCSSIDWLCWWQKV